MDIVIHPSSPASLEGRRHLIQPQDVHGLRGKTIKEGQCNKVLREDKNMESIALGGFTKSLQFTVGKLTCS